MDPLGPIQSSLAGVHQAERKEAQERAARERADKRFRRILDQTELSEELAPTEEIKAARNAKGNEQEEAHADRLQQDAYSLGPLLDKRRLDLEG